MINYVNNAYDKMLKPCDAQQFSIIVNSKETERYVLGHRGGDAKAKSKLPALTYMGVFDKEKWPPSNSPKGGGTRKAEFMRPTGLLMMDFDHVGDQAQAPLLSPQGGKTPANAIDTPVQLWEYIKKRLSESSPHGGTEGGQGLGSIALAHITPSGDGLRVVVQREKGKTIEQCQYEWCKVMDFDSIGIKADAVCKDISRLSFAPMQREILYYNPSLLFSDLPNAEDYPDGRAPLFSPQGGMTPTTSSAAMPASSPLGGTEGGQYPSEYEGIEYKEIVRRLEEQLGGRPEHGARNSFIFTMACNLRYICDDDAQWVATILPTYGEDAQKHRQTIQSAVNRPMSRTMPETLTRALRISKLSAEGGSGLSPLGELEGALPSLPTALPEPLAMLISRTPEPMRPAVAMAVFPPLGAHLYEARFHYWDNRDYEPTFMNVLVAELSSGKSAVNTPIEYIIADIEARDDVAREREREWKSQCATISNAKDKPQRPKGLAIQCLSADMTNAAFVQRLADAEGRFLYTMMDEIELLDSLKTNTRGGSVSAVLRLAFDCGKYGQERVASNAVNAKVRVRWNWNASTTVQRVRKYFARAIADGTLSRLSFSTILKDDEDWGDTHRPVYGDYGQAFADALRPYIDALCSCKGTLHCPEAEQWALSLSDELVDFARKLDDRAYATMSFRAVLMGFFRAWYST